MLMELKPVNIIVDDKIVQAEQGQNLLEACLSAKDDIPYFCWHPALGSVGSCRQCAVKVYRGPDDKTGQIVMACMTPLTENMRVSIADEEVTEFRKSVVEIVLTNHPHDCPVCEVGGECHLQDMTVLTGHHERRSRFAKRTHLNQDLGPFIKHEMNRCIGCYRCVRFYRDYAGGKDFGVFGSNRNIYFGRAESGALESEFAGNLVEVCPTGVFVDKPFSARFRRKWDMRATPSICTNCAVGCNITLQEREGEFRRVVNRYNETLNGYFLCDRGRFGAGFVESKARLRSSRLQPKDGLPEVVSSAVATDALKAVLEQENVIGIGSPRASVEANFALRSLVGADRFYSGLSDHDASVLATAIRIIREQPSHIATMRDVENADALLVLGDDPSNVAPRLALSLRQAVQRPPSDLLEARQIPEWHDSAARLAGEGHKTPCIIATTMKTRLDDLASFTYRSSPEAITRLAFSSAHRIHSSAPDMEWNSPDLAQPAQQIAETLISARNPVVVVGGGSNGAPLLQAAANIVLALRQSGIMARLCLLLPEANSVGLGFMDTKPLSEALHTLSNKKATGVIIVENDVYRRAGTTEIDKALSLAETVCVLDHIESPTSRKADMSIAVGSFADSDGTFVNFEGRAQRFFKAIFRTEAVAQTWQVLRDAGVAAGRLVEDEWRSHIGILEAMVAELPELTGCLDASPSVSPEDKNKPATLPHRYSGRTAVNAHLDVREPKPHQHDDSALGTTMEGQTSPDVVPFLWSPGWNSAQVINKFQTQIGGALETANAESFVIGKRTENPSYFQIPPLPIRSDRMNFLPMDTVSWTDELSVHAPAIAARLPVPTLSVNAHDAAVAGLVAGALAECEILNNRVQRLVVINNDLPDGVAGVTIGYPDELPVLLPNLGTLRSLRSTAG
jgi:NADH-quinone oxidoreductase subunit G